MRIVLIGCVKSSAYFLNLLIANRREPVGVVTKERSEVNADYEDLAPICEKHSIPYFYAAHLDDVRSLARIRSWEPDLIYCFGWSQLLKRPVLEIPQIGAVGFHPAALPYNRGRHPLIWALALGLSETASTFFMMDEKADAGGIISQKTIPISTSDDAASLYQKVLYTAGEQVLSFTEEFESGTVRLTPQGEGNTWRKRGVHDGEIDWRMSGEAIYNLVRALTRPYVGAHFTKDGRQIKVWRTEIVRRPGIENLEYGKVLSVKSRTDFLVKAYDTAIHILDCDPIELREGDYLL